MSPEIPGASCSRTRTVSVVCVSVGGKEGGREGEKGRREGREGEREGREGGVIQLYKNCMCRIYFLPVLSPFQDVGV